MKTKAEVIERLRVSLRLLGRDENTQAAYCRVAAKFYDFSATCPPGWSSEQKAEAYLTQRVTRDDVSASTQNHDVAALNALYASGGRKLGNVAALRAKRPQYARHCPTTPEVLALFGELHDTAERPVRLVALWLAACGLRISEGLSARLKDFRREGGKVHFVVRDPKQAHDRWVPVPELLWAPLRRQAAHARRVFQLDQERPVPLPLQVPHALGRKYPRAPHSIGWAFLFPSPAPQWHARTARPVRWHLPEGDVQRAFAAACDRLEAAGKIFARMTPHHLRHWFGTHFAGDLRDLQEILGHRSLETTALYRHPQLDRAVSPLEALAAPLALSA